MWLLIYIVKQRFLACLVAERYVVSQHIYLITWSLVSICILIKLWWDNECSWTCSLFLRVIKLIWSLRYHSPIFIILVFTIDGIRSRKKKYKTFKDKVMLSSQQAHMISLFFMWFWCTFSVCRFTTGLAITLLVWPTVTEQLHLTRNVHHNIETACPTAKTGLLGGGAFLSLDSSLFWLVALMLAGNAREDYFDEIAEKGSNSESLKSSAWKAQCSMFNGNNNSIPIYFWILTLLN